MRPIIRKIFISGKPKTKEPMHNILQKYTAYTTIMNSYPVLCPYIFPFGITSQVKKPILSNQQDIKQIQWLHFKIHTTGTK